MITIVLRQNKIPIEISEKKSFMRNMGEYFEPYTRPEGQTDIEYVQYLIQRFNNDPHFIKGHFTLELVELKDD